MQSVAASGASTSKKRGSSAPAAVSKYPRLVLTRSGRETSAPPTASPAYPRFVLTRSGRETSAPPTAPPAPAAPPETGSQQFRDNHSSASGSNGLTEEQQKVVNCCLGRNLEKGNVVLITAGAGTGKTTTLQKCVHRLIELKHTRIKYLTFNKAAAADAQARFRRENYGTKVVCNCSTFHSGVIECWRESRSRLGKMIDEKKLKELIKEKLGGDVRRFLRPYLQNQDNSEGQKKMAFAQVLFFIEKQFEQKILWDDGEIAIENADDFATYYPARLWHDKEKKRGLPLPKNFYIESGQKVWGLLTQSDERNASWTFDSIIKDVQLAKLELLYDVILVDEFQDLTRCMIALLLHQAEKFKKQVFFVGDANQLIYRFRGARDSNMDMFFEDSREFNLSRCQLTRSFRFGSQIAHAANTILFVKEKSRQRNPGYELVGGGRNVDAHVTRCQLTVKDHGKITVLAATNLSLFEYVIRLFGEGSTCPSDIGGMHVELPSFPHSIAILGKGEGSGKGKWNKLVKEINTFIDLYQGSKINQKVFHENFSDLCLDDQDASWDSVCKIINNHDLNKYCTHVALVEKYKEQTRGLVDMFCERCLNNEVDESKADICIGTIHSAKGREWDSVMLLDDCVKLLSDCFEIDRQNIDRQNKKYLFPHEKWSDNLNLWYVGLTRAKLVLGVSEKFVLLYEFLMGSLEKAFNADPEVLDQNFGVPWRKKVACGTWPNGFYLEEDVESFEESDDDNEEESPLEKSVQFDEQTVLKLAENLAEEGYIYDGETFKSAM